MEYKREPDKVFDDINRKLGDVIQTAITGGLFYACKQFKKKPKIAHVQFSTTACAFCQSHCGTFSLSEFEQSKASNFHSGCRCKTLVTWNKEKQHKKVEKETRRLLSQAREKEKIITPLLNKLENGDRIYLYGLDYKIKTKDSLERKLLGLAREFKESPFVISSKLKDTLRYTYIVDKDIFYEEFSRITDSLKNIGYNIFSLKNTFPEKEMPYKGINVTFSDRDNYVFEIQFHTKQSIKTKDLIHPYYEKYRLLDPKSSKAQNLLKRMVEISSEVECPKGAEKI